MGTQLLHDRIIPCQCRLPPLLPLPLNNTPCTIVLLHLPAHTRNTQYKTGHLAGLKKARDTERNEQTDLPAPPRFPQTRSTFSCTTLLSQSGIWEFLFHTRDQNPLFKFLTYDERHQKEESIFRSLPRIRPTAIQNRKICISTYNWYPSIINSKTMSDLA